MRVRALPADKNTLNVTKQTALHLATLAGCVSTVRMLVEHGAKILFTAAEVKSSKVPASVLHLAAASHSEALVSLFVELGLDINLTDAAGRIPLHCAARAVPKNPAFVDFLLARGANAKAVDEEGQGVLHYAITVRRLGSPHTCDTLLHITRPQSLTFFHRTTKQVKWWRCAGV